jgi:hypothetical protein
VNVGSKQQDFSLLSDLPVELVERWAEIEAHLDDIVECLDRESILGTGALANRVDAVSHLLKTSPRLKAVLSNRDTLQLLLPLISGSMESTTIAHSIESSVRNGVQRIAHNEVYRRRWLQLFWYPIAVVIVAFFVCVLLSFIAAPELERLLRQLAGLDGVAGSSVTDFPWVTQLFFGVAKVLRSLWVGIIVLVAAAAIGACWVNRRGRMRNASGSGWWDEYSVSVRGALAVWADHVASLLTVGIGSADAFRFASAQALKYPLRNLSNALAVRERVVGTQKQRYFPLRKYAMLDQALKLESPLAKITALEEVSRYYADRDREVSTWWLAWASSAILWMTGALVFFMFIAMFLPIRGVISGLTGATN